MPGDELEPADINSSDNTVGFIIPGSNAPPQVSFFYDYATNTVTPITHGTDSVFATHMNDENVVVGTFVSSSDMIDHGFIYDANGGSFKQFDVPGAAQTEIAAIADNGDIAGDYIDASNNRIGFLIQQATGQMTTFDIGFVGDINSNDVVVGGSNGIPGSSKVLVYVGNNTVLDITPANGSGYATEVNANNQVTGNIQFSGSDASHGFIANPITV
jgi:hypothetical protein